MANMLWLPVIGWLVIPIINFLMNKLLSYLDFNLSRKLRELELHIVPNLKLILGDVTEQRILRGAKDEDKGYGYDVKTLGELDKDLKSALYEAEDVLDVVEYRRIEKTVIRGDGKSVGTSIISWVLLAIGDCVTCCKRSSLGQKLWQCAQNQNQMLRDLVAKLQQCAQDLDLKFWDLVAKLQQYAQYLNQMFRDLPVRATFLQGAQSLPLHIHQGAAGQPPMPGAHAAEFRDDIEQGSATTPSPTPVDSPSNPLTPNALPNSAGSATEFRADNQHGSAEAAATTLDAPTNSLVQMICDCLVYGFSALRSVYLAARNLRDWLYGPVGIKNGDGTAIDCVFSINEIISLRKKIKNIEYIVSDSKKSPLLNKSSSSTPKGADKESSSSTCTVKNSAEESTSTQKECDDVYRSIKKKVFGRDKDRKRISRMLREGPNTNAARSRSTSKPCSVIGIYGITGSGKTTLAQHVCDYEKGAGHFNLIMFIHVGKTFSVRDIFRDMLEQIKQSRPPNDEGLKILKKELEEKLKDQRFLLVLDDLWVTNDNQNERDILLDMLSAARSGSRVLVTAQKTDAAQALGAKEQISIPDLREGVYLSLFMHHARPDASDDDGEYRRVGSKIAKKLRSSPIAAVTVGKQLQRNKSISFWETTANLDMLDMTMGALWWSYQQLGVDIRRCFAYCSTFPRGYGLERDELVRIWIAQGFVNTRGNATEELEDVGQRYFDELLTFSFLQAERKYFVLKAKTFTIHDLLHELAERVCGSEFFRIGLNNRAPIDIPRGVHHLFVETNNGAEIIENIADMENLRTLIINEPSAWRRETMERNHDLEKVLDRLFMRLTKLRVLIIKLKFDIQGLSVPASIDHMEHLRYLGFRRVSVNLILPRTFSKLYHIQIIDIPCMEASCPEDMDNLIYLRHISGPLSFPNIGRLTSLQTLEEFIVKDEHGHGLNQLVHLNKLRGTLRISGLRDVGRNEKDLEAHLAHKEQLRKLKLNFGLDRDNKVRPDVEAEALEGLCPPKGLEELQIFDYKGSTYPTWMLTGRHPDTPKQLHKLSLFYCSQLASIPEDSVLFIGLRELQIDNCDWDRLPQNMERLVALQRLKISWCDKMELLPTLPQALKEICISECCMLRNIRIMECPRLEFVCEQEKHLEACTSPEYCQDTAPTGTPEQSPYSMIRCPCLATLSITGCANLVKLLNLPPFLKELRIHNCGELCSVSGQLGGLEKLDIAMCNKLQSVDSLGDASSLETLFLSSCQCLASLGSGGGPGSYLALQRLQIKYCPAMDMKQFNKNVLDGLLWKEISHALSSNPPR